MSLPIIMVSVLKRILLLLVVGSLFLVFTLDFGFCYSPNATIPFDINELTGGMYVTSPVENFTYSDSSIVVNVSLHIGGIEYEPNTHYVPYQNMSCVYSLDDIEWQGMSLVSVGGTEAFSSLVNPYWHSNTWLYYTATLHNVSGGQHYLRIDVKPAGIPIHYSSSQGSLVYFSVINHDVVDQPSTSPILVSLLILASILVLTVLFSGIMIYFKKHKERKQS